MADFDYVALAKNLLAELFAAAKGENSGSAKPPVESTSGPLGTKINDLINEFGKVAGAASGTVIGLNSVKDASKAWSKTVEYMASQADKVGKQFGDAIRYIDYNRQLSVDAQKVGVGQGQGVRAEGRAQAAGYDNLKDEIGAIGKMGNQARSFGNSAEDANNKFLLFGKNLQDTELAGKLKNLGLNTAREIANVASLAAGGKEDMLNSAEGRKKLAEQTIQLATEIERTKNATGKSREEIIAEIAERKNSARGILEDRLYRSDAERQAADGLKFATAGMGKSMQDITSTIAAGGYLNKQQRTELQVATGGRAGQYMAAVRDNRRTAGLADNDPQKIAAQKRLDNEIARANAYQTSRQFAQRGLTTQNPEQKAAYEKMALENVEAGRQRAIMRETGKSPTAAREELRNRGDVMLENRTAEGFKRPLGAPGTLNEGARPASIMQDAVESFRKNTAAMTKSLGELNEELGRNPGLLKGLTKATTVGGAVPSGMTQDQADANAKKNIETLKDTVGMGEAKPGEGSGEGLKNLRNKTKEKREHGTLGELGVPTEPKDVVAKLHKGETVATPEQLKNLMSGSAANAISELMKSATNKTTPMPAPSGNVDISKITSGLKEITTTISSVTGGGSTTRSTVENDDAKAAKKELETIKAQFQTEKDAIRSQVKTNLGPDAKPADIMRAMRDDPQAKALEARMQEATAKLSTRINDGTTTKTSTEPSTQSISSDIQKNIARGMSQANATALAQKTDGQRSAPPPVNIADIQKNITQGLTQQDAQKKADLQAQTRIQEATANLSTRIAAATKVPSIVPPVVEKPKATPSIVAPPVVEKPKASSPVSGFESIFEKFIGSKNKFFDSAKINTAAEPVIDRTKINDATRINDATSATIDAVSSKLSAVNNKKTIEENSDTETDIEEPNIEQQSNKVGLNDLNEQLIQLNTSIRQLIEHSAETVETATKQVKATKRLSGNRFG